MSKEKSEVILEGDYTVIKASSAPAVDGLATLVHVEASHVGNDFLGRIMIDTPKASIYDAIKKAAYDGRLRVRIELVTESDHD